MMRKIVKGVRYCEWKGVMIYLSSEEVSKKWNISNRRVQFLASKGRIDGAKKVSGVWLIPDNVEKPTSKNKVIDETEDSLKKRNEIKNLISKYVIEFSEKISNSLLRPLFLSGMNSVLLYKFKKCSKDTAIDLSRFTFGEFQTSGKTSDKIFCDIFEFLVNEYSYSNPKDGISDLSWSYQYFNKILTDNTDEFSKTQFFTEKYMIDNLLNTIELVEIKNYIFDPCCGGGNMITEVLWTLLSKKESWTISEINKILNQIIGVDVDRNLAYVASLSMKLICISKIKSWESLDKHKWKQILPRIYHCNENTLVGSLAVNTNLQNVEVASKMELSVLNQNCDIVITNPPFATQKGMNKVLSEYLKLKFPLANSDICVAFIDRISEYLSPNGIALVVAQNSWMYLNSFTEFRKKILTKVSFEEIIDLGSGAFADLSGEKSNVSLIKFLGKAPNPSSNLTYINLKKLKLNEKVKELSKGTNKVIITQSEILENENSRFDFLNTGSFRDFYYSGKKVGDYAIPMQGTSTGDSKKLTGYFWEHFGDSDWKLVSKGGGYSRWHGLNKYVVKWGENGEYIKNQKGSALRNTKYFSETKMFFSDTGTSGLNVRDKLSEQIFIASGPGIRVKNGKSLALLAFFNSRLASYYMRLLSPKLTIAAGYISNLPMNDTIANSSYLEMHARICIEAKTMTCMIRPNNIEYSGALLQILPNKIEEAALHLMEYELNCEIKKIDSEQYIDEYIQKVAGIENLDIFQMNSEIGQPCYYFDNNVSIKEAYIDREWAKATDLSGNLNKVKHQKFHLGSDGIVEYLSQKIRIHPKKLVLSIIANSEKFPLMLHKYKDLVLHNFILELFGYNTSTGLQIDQLEIDDIVKSCSKRFTISTEILEQWVRGVFPIIHQDIFEGISIVEVTEKNIIKKEANNEQRYSK